MKTYFAVTSAYYDDGRVTANIVGTREADTRPAAGYMEMAKCDLYTDWFDTREKAEAFVDECRAS